MGSQNLRAAMPRQRMERREAWACSRRGAGLPLRPLTGGRVVASSTPAQRPAPSRAERGRRNAPLRGREELVGMEPQPTARRVAKGRHYLGVRRRKPEGLGEGVEEGESGEEALAEAAPTPPRSAWRGATGGRGETERSHRLLPWPARARRPGRTPLPSLLPRTWGFPKIF